MLVSTGCQPKSKSDKPEVAQKGQENTLMETSLTADQLKGYETAYFASGCFWCVEAIFESVKGVKEVYSGYSGGTEKNPTYKEVSYGKTTHAEAVEVYYDPKIISFAQLVQVFFGSHDPTSLNRQGPDRGTQYRSIAFYKDEAQKKIITDYIAQLEAENIYGRPIVTEVKKFDKFYRAEEYHQDYEKRNPNNTYIQNVSVPRLNRFKENFKSYLKKESH
ncbi:peptide-methionine (S)-S-oxide reductase [Flagellimonas taeanensis]|uniref:peptide-methionine (S)-S-oxide reductase MsrA n=1 Tax=Flavobacteriaceae TaxID=49546 RepID=UPI000E6A06D8|nr:MULTISPECIES: peptide-methionine (S)-S-oxide reductase MsrA [Allomuricauda]MDC6384505.1 peptide-methionine (S)-S-oxide reductase MsrA [Muricauda sp. SK9]RIV52184.1 peptide-methionine (S)-S-oxide reductase [Allomuricauda taeanensis]